MLERCAYISPLKTAFFFFVRGIKMVILTASTRDST